MEREDDRKHICLEESSLGVVSGSAITLCASRGRTKSAAICRLSLVGFRSNYMCGIDRVGGL